MGPGRAESIGSSAADASANANKFLIKAAESTCVEDLKFAHVGSLVGAVFTPGADNIAFLDYLTDIEGAKHMFRQMMHEGAQHQHSLYPVSQTPELFVTSKSTTSNRFGPHLP
jgi:hypothetical protein